MRDHKNGQAKYFEKYARTRQHGYVRKYFAKQCTNWKKHHVGHLRPTGRVFPDRLIWRTHYTEVKYLEETTCRYYSPTGFSQEIVQTTQSQDPAASNKNVRNERTATRRYVRKFSQKNATSKKNTQADRSFLGLVILAVKEPRRACFLCVFADYFERSIFFFLSRSHTISSTGIFTGRKHALPKTP